MLVDVCVGLQQQQHVAVVSAVAGARLVPPLAMAVPFCLLRGNCSFFLLLLLLELRLHAPLRLTPLEKKEKE